MRNLDALYARRQQLDDQHEALKAERKEVADEIAALEKADAEANLAPAELDQQIG